MKLRKWSVIPEKGSTKDTLLKTPTIDVLETSPCLFCQRTQLGGLWEGQMEVQRKRAFGKLVAGTWRPSSLNLARARSRAG